jgi:hypothetical protein
MDGLLKVLHSILPENQSSHIRETIANYWYLPVAYQLECPFHCIVFFS